LKREGLRGTVATKNNLKLIQIQGCKDGCLEVTGEKEHLVTVQQKHC